MSAFVWVLTDFSGAFIFCVMVMEDSDTGPIVATGIKSWKKKHLIAGFIMIYNTLKKVGINPILHQIDNGFLADLIDEI